MADGDDILGTGDAQAQTPDEAVASTVTQAAPPVTPQDSGVGGSMGSPLLLQMIGQIAHPGGRMGAGLQTPGRPPSRLDAFENFLGHFISSFATGMANSGTGPAANIRGAGAAAMAPRAMAIQQQQLALQRQQAESEAQLRGSQAALAQSQAQMVQTPYGAMPASLAKAIFGAMITGQSRVAAAGTQKRFLVTPVGLYDTQSQKFAAGGTNAIQVTPDIAADYGLPQQLIGKTVPLSQFSQLERGAAYQNATVQGSQGPALVNKITGKTQNLGLGSPAANPIAVARLQLAQKTFERDTFGTLFGKDIPSSLVDESGNTIGWKSPSGPTQNVKQMGQQSADLGKLFSKVADEVRAAQKSGKLGPIPGRISEFMTGKVGADDPEFAELRALGSLTSSGMLRAHFGARGGQQMYGHFENLFNTGRMTAGDLLGALKGFSVFMDQYAQRVRTAGEAHTQRRVIDLTK